VAVPVKLLDWGEDGHRSEQDIAAVRAAFSQEVTVWHKLDHPNVTKVLLGSTGRLLFLSILLADMLCFCNVNLHHSLINSGKLNFETRSQYSLLSWNASTEI
jgi:hypothetical protein